MDSVDQAKKLSVREEKGKTISEKHEQVKRLDENHYSVQSQTTQHKWYDVVAMESGWVCNCADHTFRHLCCKHIHAVEFSIKLRKEVLEKNQTKIEEMVCDRCIQCQSTNIVKHGIRHNKYGDIQRLSCKDCKKRFSFNLGFEGMKASPKTITSALQLYFTGESLRNVQKFLRLQGVEVSHKTVYVWINKYIGLMEQYLDKMVPQVGETWRADELYLKVKGNTKYLYAMMDDETRFWIARQISDRKYTEDVRPLFREGIEKAQKRPNVLITDGAKNFMDGFKKEFWTLKDPRAIHIRHIHVQGDKNNNKMERLNGEIRDREKVMRGLKKESSPLLSGYQIYHNYVRPHMALNGKTPSEACGITVKGDNKWLTLIQNASTNK